VVVTDYSGAVLACSTGASDVVCGRLLRAVAGMLPCRAAWRPALEVVGCDP
jgi:hypothetical protein